MISRDAPAAFADAIASANQMLRAYGLITTRPGSARADPCSKGELPARSPALSLMSLPVGHPAGTEHTFDRVGPLP
jgi:hypothetical protein